MEMLFNLFLGIGLSAATGFRVFVPPLVLSLMAQFTDMSLPERLIWMANPAVTLIFAVAVVFEVLAYYIPWLDNLLDTLATPIALVAGTLLTNAFLPDLDPSIRWLLSILLGGGSAGGVQALSTGLRLLSSTSTAGLANPLLATTENTAAAGLSLMAILLPVLAFIAVIVLLFFALRRLRRKKLVNTQSG